MKDFRSLKVWEKSHAKTLAIYQATNSFPKDERFGLTSQLRRCCVSVPSNVAEGCGRATDGELAQFLQYAGIRERNRVSTFACARPWFFCRRATTRHSQSPWKR
jgi:hypothetical protein